MPDDRGHVLALAIKAALAPLQAEIAVLKAMLPDVGTLRERLAVVEARPPVPGPPGPAGADGFTPDELTITQDADDERVLTLGYRRGLVEKSLGSVRLATPRYCGTWTRERDYRPGDQVTHEGGLWHCHGATRKRPGDGGDWQLQVKRGEGR